jgi:hypothetical protein
VILYSRDVLAGVILYSRDVLAGVILLRRERHSRAGFLQTRAPDCLYAYRTARYPGIQYLKCPDINMAAFLDVLLQSGCVDRLRLLSVIAEENLSLSIRIQAFSSVLAVIHLCPRG